MRLGRRTTHFVTDDSIVSEYDEYLSCIGLVGVTEPRPHPHLPSPF
jgi:hypothetical protein